MGTLDKLKAYLNGDSKAVTPSKSNSKKKSTYTPSPEAKRLYRLADMPLPEIKIPGLAKELFPFQNKGVAFIERRKGRAIIGDEPGLGKTAQALAYLQLHPELRPAFIISPASLKFNWAKEVFKWMEKRDENQLFMLFGKKKKIVEEVSIKSNGRLVLNRCKMPDNGIFIINYDIVANEETILADDEGNPILKKDKVQFVPIKNTGWFDILFDLAAEIVITDEAQLMANEKALRTKYVSMLAKDSPKYLALTGGLIENRPLEAFNVINLVDPSIFPSKWNFQHRYCGAKHNGFGWSFNGASNTRELHEKLKDICIRRKKEDVLPDLPPKIRTVVPIELTNRSDYEKAERDLIEWIRSTKGNLKAEKAANSEALVRINEMKQLCSKGKMTGVIDWIEDYLSNDNKLVVFTTHTWVLDAICNHFKKCSVKVNGSVTGVKRDQAVELFQSDPKITLFVGDLEAAGVGLTLTAAYATATVELGWNPSQHNQAEDRVHRIGQTNDFVNAYYLLARDTIEEELADIIDVKRKVVNQVLDGDFDFPDDLSLVAGLLQNMEEEND